MQVDAQLLAGESLVAIARTTGVNKFAIQRHKKHSAQPVAVASSLSEVELSDQRLATLSDQLQQQFAAAVATGDAKLSLECSKARVRVETERHRRIVKRTEAATDATAKPTFSTWDEALKKARALRQQKIDRGFLLCPLCESNLILPQQVREAWAALEAARALPDVHICSPDAPKTEVVQNVNAPTQ
jgi:hypothetical protein